MDGQFTLDQFIEAREKNPVTNSTCIVINGECKNVDWKELFDSSKYDSLAYMNYLRQDIFIEDAGVYVVLRAKLFYDWIGVKRKKKLKDLFKKK